MLGEDFVEELKMQPQTYKTILGKQFDNRNTITNIVRRKINSLVQYRFVCVGILDGTRFGERIFYVLDKEYTIVILRHKQKFSYLYCNAIIEINSDELLLDNVFELERDRWVSVGDLVIDRGWLVRFF